MSDTLCADIFRAYDIRGKVNEEFFPPDAYAIGLAIGDKLRKNRHSRKMILGRDGRLSSPEVRQHLLKGLLAAGCQVVDVGLAPTPVVYFAMQHLEISNAVIVTASHNPGHYNGIKMVINNAPLAECAIRQLYHSIDERRCEPANNSGTLSHYDDILQDYTAAVVANIKLQKPLKVAIDCGNGVTSLLAERLFTQLGCEVTPLFCQLDGRFPNHSPDPTEPENLKALQSTVLEGGLDLGIAFDGDGDRMIAVDSEANILWPDRIMMLLTHDILEQQPGASIVSDIKSSQLLKQVIETAGGKAVLCPTGHSHLKRFTLEHDAPLGGEFSGHIIFRDRWSNFDDGLYAAARLLESLSLREESCQQVFAALPDSYSTPEHRLFFKNNAIASKVMASLLEVADFENVIRIDGLRVEFERGWGLVRESHTSASLTFRFEAECPDVLESIKQHFRRLMRRAGIEQPAPF